MQIHAIVAFSCLQDFNRSILTCGMQVIVANSKKVTRVRESYIPNKARVIIVSLTFYVKEILLKCLFFSHVL